MFEDGFEVLDILNQPLDELAGLDVGEQRSDLGGVASGQLLNGICHESDVVTAGLCLFLEFAEIHPHSLKGLVGDLSVELIEEVGQVGGSAGGVTGTTPGDLRSSRQLRESGFAGDAKASRLGGKHVKVTCHVLQLEGAGFAGLRHDVQRFFGLQCVDAELAEAGLHGGGHVEDVGLRSCGGLTDWLEHGNSFGWVHALADHGAEGGCYVGLSLVGGDGELIDGNRPLAHHRLGLVA